MIKIVVARMKGMVIRKSILSLREGMIVVAVKSPAVMIIVTIAVRKEALKMAMISYWSRSSAFSTNC
jgi:hypothetical protein